jgi:hypothetical protein
VKAFCCSKRRSLILRQRKSLILNNFSSTENKVEKSTTTATAPKLALKRKLVRRLPKILMLWQVDNNPLFKDLSKNIEVAREEKVKSLETSWYGATRNDGDDNEAEIRLKIELKVTDYECFQYKPITYN